MVRRRRAKRRQEERTRRSGLQDRKSTRLNSSHVRISYAVFCLKKKKIVNNPERLPVCSLRQADAIHLLAVKAHSLLPTTVVVPLLAKKKDQAHTALSTPARQTA